jgi:hypothetical protein
MQQMSDTAGQVKQPLIHSYLALRRAIGVLGVVLPVILLFGGLYHDGGIQSSISSYYHTNMRDVFVGILCAVAVFLFFYKGYGPEEGPDNLVGNVGGVFALFVAILPTATDAELIVKTVFGDFQTPSTAVEIIGYLHFGSAALFFGMLIFFSLRLFPKGSTKHPPTKEKQTRNKWYRGCGWIMITCIASIVFYKVVGDQYPVLVNMNPVFWLEFIALWAFGISWFIKGETLFKDAKR